MPCGNRVTVLAGWREVITFAAEKLCPADGLVGLWKIRIGGRTPYSFFRKSSG